MEFEGIVEHGMMEPGRLGWKPTEGGIEKRRD
jgi:hypothetical protein